MFHPSCYRVEDRDRDRERWTRKQVDRWTGGQVDRWTGGHWAGNINKLLLYFKFSHEMEET